MVGTVRRFGSTRRGRAREHALLTAAFDLLAEVGYERLTMDAVAARAHASKSTIYRRWPNKASLMADTLRYHMEPADVLESDTGSLRGDLLALLKALRDKFSGKNLARVSALAYAMHSDTELAETFRRFLVPRRERVIAEILRRANARGDAPMAVTPQLLIDLLSGVLFTRALLIGEDIDDNYLDLVIDGILLPVINAPPREGSPVLIPAPPPRTWSSP